MRFIAEKEILTSEVEKVALVYAEWYKRKSHIVAAATEALFRVNRFY